MNQEEILHSSFFIRDDYIELWNLAIRSNKVGEFIEKFGNEINWMWKGFNLIKDENNYLKNNFWFYEMFRGRISFYTPTEIDKSEIDIDLCNKVSFTFKNPGIINQEFICSLSNCSNFEEFLYTYNFRRWKPDCNSYYEIIHLGFSIKAERSFYYLFGEKYEKINSFEKIIRFIYKPYHLYKKYIKYGKFGRKKSKTKA